MNHEKSVRTSLSASLLLLIAYPFLVHVGVLTGVFWPALVNLILLFFLQLQPWRTIYWVLLVLLSGMVAWLTPRSAGMILYAPPILTIFLLFGIFFRSLLPGSDPLVSRIARLMHENPSTQLLQYTHAVTIGWVIFLLLMLVEVIALTLFAPQQQWSLFTNFYNYLFIVSFFFVEFLCRRFFVDPTERMSIKHFLSRLFSINYRKLFQQR